MCQLSRHALHYMSWMGLMVPALRSLSLASCNEPCDCRLVVGPETTRGHRFESRKDEQFVHYMDVAWLPRATSYALPAKQFNRPPKRLVDIV
jgi:hypothetical protein